MSLRDIKKAHPNLALHGGCRQTSNEDPAYNCIAWAAHDKSRWWWPWPAGKGYYWPVEAPMENTVEAFTIAFGTLGYHPCGLDTALDPDFEKVAIYTYQGGVKHMARQLRSGRWTSKAGRIEDFSHRVEGLSNDPMYGVLTLILKRPRKRKR